MSIQALPRMHEHIVTCKYHEIAAPGHRRFGGLVKLKEEGQEEEDEDEDEE
jgi:hypothetical protein